MHVFSSKSIYSPVHEAPQANGSFQVLGFLVWHFLLWRAFGDFQEVPNSPWHWKTWCGSMFCGVGPCIVRKVSGFLACCGFCKWYVEDCVCAECENNHVDSRQNLRREVTWCCCLGCRDASDSTRRTSFRSCWFCCHRDTDSLAQSTSRDSQFCPAFCRSGLYEWAWPRISRPAPLCDDAGTPQDVHSETWIWNNYQYPRTRILEHGARE